MENKSLDWWHKLQKWEQIKYAEEEQWTTPEQITNYQIEMIYKNVIYGY